MFKRSAKSPRSRLVPAFIIALLAFVLMGLAGFAYLQSLLRPANSGATQKQIFVVKKGQSVDAIGAKLAEAGLIKSPLAFKYAVMKAGVAQKIQAGTFRISADMDVFAITQELTHGTLDVWVTVVEGWRREEIAGAIEQAFADKGAEFDTAAFLEATEGKEGFLYPDTYLLPLSASEASVASILTNTFDKKVTPDLREQIKDQGKSLDEIVTMASLIEREARSEEARKMVSGILWKRLELEWPLQVDATLQYALGYDTTQSTWWPQPTAADKTIKSPYNTYQNAQLPPAPICSPSLSSIKAAIDPTASDYLFYITDNQGVMRYAKTNEEHNANVAQYLR